MRFIRINKYVHCRKLNFESLLKLTMKINKTGGCLSLCILIGLAFASIYYRDIVDKSQSIYLTLFKSITENIAKKERPLQRSTKVNSDSNQIKQLLQQRYMTAVERQSGLIGNSNDPENKKMIEEAINDFYSSEDPEDREFAIITLGEYSIPKAKKAILFALNDPEIHVREQTVVQISEWPNEDERSIMLQAALKNDNPDVVVQALESIVETDNSSLINRLKQLGKDKNEDIREAAKTALEMVEE